MLRDIMSFQEKYGKLFSPTKYLNYDPIFLCNAYLDEAPIAPYIPYKEEICWMGDTWEETQVAANDISVQRMPQPFSLASYPLELKSFQASAYSEFKASGKISRDTNVIRLESLEIAQEETRLIVQKAKYTDQVQSNLVLDWADKHALNDVGVATLRSYFLSQYPKKLPPLSEQRLVNTIGISVILFYRNSSGTYVPYLPMRTKGLIDDKKILAVFEGGYTCTASGAAEWSQGETFDRIFTEDMYAELHDEVGVERNDVEVMLPLALCREFLRGGKPQIFYAGLTTLSETELAEKRRHALQRQEALPDKVEIEDTQLVVSDFEQLKEDTRIRGLTSEAIAGVFYAEKFMRQYCS